MLTKAYELSRIRSSRGKNNKEIRKILLYYRKVALVLSGLGKYIYIYLLIISSVGYSVKVFNIFLPHHKT